MNITIKYDGTIINVATHLLEIVVNSNEVSRDNEGDTILIKEGNVSSGGKSSVLRYPQNTVGISSDHVTIEIVAASYSDASKYVFALKEDHCIIDLVDEFNKYGMIDYLVYKSVTFPHMGEQDLFVGRFKNAQSARNAFEKIGTYNPSNNEGGYQVETYLFNDFL